MPEPTSPPPFRSGSRVYLRALSAADAEGPYLHWMHDPLVTQFLESRFTAHTADSLREFIRTIQANPAFRFWGIALADGDRHIGNIKLGPINWIHRFADVGLIIGERDCWRQGYATDAINLVTEFAFTTLNLHRLTAGCYASNVGSARAFLKAGWQQDGLRRGHFFSDGRYDDEILLGVVRAESAALPPA